MLEINNLNKSFGRFRIKNINLSVANSDYFVLLGPSGAGKSVLLEMIAGLVDADSGSIRLRGEDITSKTIDKRKTGLIFQHPALFPHMNVMENIQYAIKGESKRLKKEKATTLANHMGIFHLLGSGTATLSGGELQRVALARVLASEPYILLLDEPLSAIDSSLKAELRGLLRDLNKNGLPVLHVTHDYEETIALATAMAVIEDGEIIQKGTPEEIFNKPTSIFAAAFAGEHNFFRATIQNQIIIPDEHKHISIIGPDEVKDGIAHIMIRNKNILLSNELPELSTMNIFKGTIQSINPLRDGHEVKIDCGMFFYSKITKQSVERMNLYSGKTVFVCFKASAVEVIR
jgi:molybdopterin-binding protein